MIDDDDVTQLERSLQAALDAIRKWRARPGLEGDVWRAGYEEYWRTRVDHPIEPPKEIRDDEELGNAYYGGFAIACLEHRILERDAPSEDTEEPELFDFLARVCRKLKRPGDPELDQFNDYVDPRFR